MAEERAISAHYAAFQVRGGGVSTCVWRYSQCLCPHFKRVEAIGISMSERRTGAYAHRQCSVRISRLYRVARVVTEKVLFKLLLYVPPIRAITEASLQFS